jgi:hypothetical protein
MEEESWQEEGQQAFCKVIIKSNSPPSSSLIVEVADRTKTGLQDLIDWIHKLRDHQKH